jgi:protein-tyrosine phosphatase
MFGLFKKKQTKRDITFNYAELGVDMHSHVLPGIDDGAQTPEDSIVLIKKMMELGIRKIIATPHIMADYYRNDAISINNALDILKAELQRQEIDIEIEAAAEHYYDETFEARIDRDELMLMGGKYVLFELPFISKPPTLFVAIQKLKNKGYQPILAHPERYPYLTLEEFKTIHDWGCLFQLNIISLAGYYGRETKKIAETLVDHNLIDFTSSDMHHPRHAAAFHDALSTTYAAKLITEGYPLRNKMLL